MSILVALTLLAATLLVAPTGVDAQTNPYQRGPTPTAASLERAGSYSVSTSNVSSSVSGFGGGTIYYPTGTSETFGGIAVSPGYTASSSSMAWYGRRLASHGFVVIVIDTNSRFDQPNSRGTQLLNSLNYLENSAPSAVRARLDASRMAVSGHSMGGGGSLRASNTDSSLKASVPLTAWHTTKTWSSNSVPQLIIGAQRDSTASVSSHSVPFYNGLPNSTPKLYVELAGAGHFAPNSTNATISRNSVAWMKRFVDNDSRYNQFLCGASAPTTGDSAISRTMSNCDTGWGSGGGDDGGTPAPVCIRSSNSAHVDADRAVSIWGIAYARGSADRLGYATSLSFSSLQQTGPNSWSLVSSC
ncbi:MAG: poly(ethylene terephthalate) hydrolase family protein [Acidimicrobiales bacterium]